MNISKTISVLKQRIQESKKGEIAFKTLRCYSPNCSCVTGYKWSDLKFDFTTQQLIQKNGHKFQLSISLGNELERFANKELLNKNI